MYKTVWMLLLAAWGIFQESIAQRNLIDVPSGEIVERGKTFLQVQGVLAKHGLNSSAVFTYGLGSNFEIGLTFHQLVFKRSQGIEVNAEKPEENPDLLINAQKGFDVNDWFMLGIGTSSGVNAARAGQSMEWKIVLGAQLPFPGSDNENGAVVQLSKN
jgi:hypothetical protein